MAEEKKKGILAKLFGTKNSCCCNMKIEEVPAAQPPQPSDSSQESRCCDGDRSTRDISGPGRAAK